MKKFVVSAALFAACGLVSAQVEGAVISLTGAPYGQDFNGLNASGTVAWAQETNVPGWSAYTTQVNNVTTITASGGGSATGSLYAYGNAGERALGSVANDTFASTGGFVYYVAHFINDTGVEISDLKLGYTGEQWRLAAQQPNAGALRVQTAVGPTPPTFTQSTTGWSAAITPLTFTTPQVNTSDGSANAISGNDAANRSVIAPVDLGLTIPAGGEFWVRWRDFNETGNDHGLAIDDVNLTYVPEPASLAVLGLGGLGLLARRRTR